jgi:hypothetical protein
VDELTLLWRHNDEQKALVCILGEHMAIIDTTWLQHLERDGFEATVRTSMGKVAGYSSYDFFEVLDWAEGKLIEFSE